MSSSEGEDHDQEDNSEGESEEYQTDPAVAIGVVQL